ncbi:hypothetical protein DPMN_142104 [Dreissena polymorpha]|uniref:Uncharacterized protein n=1 Tax=Dreissena polymorpha TaxID=45954 RepID=A0A9D4GAN3_DREPO|nr:hypothetical protein DPMN_142104 [Dreissena polymorpha]
MRYLTETSPSGYYYFLFLGQQRAPKYIGVIGIAAGLSVFVPIACVAIIQISLVCRRRRRSATEVLVSSTSSSGSCDQADLPPYYSFLFGDTVRSISEIEFTTQNLDTGHSYANFCASVTQLSPRTGSEIYRRSQCGSTALCIPENQSVVSCSPVGLPDGPEVPEPGPKITSEAWHSRFPICTYQYLIKPFIKRFVIKLLCYNTPVVELVKGEAYFP